jgi:hypothetical protein
VYGSKVMAWKDVSAMELVAYGMQKHTNRLDYGLCKPCLAYRRDLGQVLGKRIVWWLATMC